MFAENTVSKPIECYRNYDLNSSLDGIVSGRTNVGFVYARRIVAGGLNVNRRYSHRRFPVNCQFFPRRILARLVSRYGRVRIARANVRSYVYQPSTKPMSPPSANRSSPANTCTCDSNVRVSAASPDGVRRRHTVFT